MAIRCPRAQTIAFLLAAIILGAACLTRPFLAGLNGQEKKPDAVAEVAIWIIQKRPAVENHGAKPGVEDLLSTQIYVLRSPLVLGGAIKKGDLASLKSFENVADPVATIRKRFSVKRDPESAMVLTLTYRGPSAEDNLKVLSAIIESFQECLDNAYQDVGRRSVELLTKARDLLQKDLAEAEKKYMDFMQNSMVSTYQLGKEMDIERVRALDRKKTELLIGQIELRTELKQSEGDATRPGLQMKIQEWATRAGFDKLPKAIQEKGQVAVYKEYLEEKLHCLIATEMALDQRMGEEKQKYRDSAKNDLLEAHLRKDVERYTLLYEATVKRLQELNLFRDSRGIDVRMLSAPTVRKGP